MHNGSKVSSVNDDWPQAYLAFYYSAASRPRMQACKRAPHKMMIRLKHLYTQSACIIVLFAYFCFTYKHYTPFAIYLSLLL